MLYRGTIEVFKRFLTGLDHLPQVLALMRHNNAKH